MGIDRLDGLFDRNPLPLLPRNYQASLGTALDDDLGAAARLDAARRCLRIGVSEQPASSLNVGRAMSVRNISR